MITKRFSILFIAVLFLVPLNAFSADPGVTDTEVVLGVSTPLTGPAAGWGVTISGGMKAWAEHVNDQGGVHGRKIKLIIKDDGYNPARAVANLQEMKNKADIFFDYNPPIRTNETVSRIVELTSENDLALDSRYRVFPNPARDRIVIRNAHQNTRADIHFKIYSVSGQLLGSGIVQGNLIDIRHLHSGVHFLHLYQDTGHVEILKIVIAPG